MSIEDARPNDAPGVIFWFRKDLRMHDAPALRQAIARATACGGWLLPVHVDDPAQRAMTAWGFERTGTHRLAWQEMAVQGLARQLQGMGSCLLRLQGAPEQLLPELAHRLGATQLVCEDIPAPEEIGQVRKLIRAGLDVETVWQSTLIAPGQLPMSIQAIPDQFSVFRKAIESAQVRAHPPAASVASLPRRPDLRLLGAWWHAHATPLTDRPLVMPHAHPHSAFPYAADPRCRGTEEAALEHLKRYCARQLPQSYKNTRNGLLGMDYSTKWSPWLSTGALSARQAWAAIAEFEGRHGAGPGTYWIWFELLWRDHFRWLHLKHGSRLYHGAGLTGQSEPSHDPAAFDRWRQGLTGQPFIDAGMHELASTGYLSNRMRQNVASYLIHDLGCDWRAGAAWFESQLIDYDVCSNQGNWLYLSGRGTDPRGTRRFNPEKQAADYDADGTYRRLWLRDWD